MDELGVVMGREPARWSYFQPDLSGKINFAPGDRALRVGANYDIKRLIVLNPSRKPGKEGGPNQIIEFNWENIDLWEEFVREIVERYDGDDIFQSNPDKSDPPPDEVKLAIKKDPIKYWQIVGEPAWQWGGTNIPRENYDTLTAEYLEFLRRTSAIIKEADPDAKVILGGLTGLSIIATAEGYTDLDYIEKKKKIMLNINTSPNPFEYILSGKIYVTQYENHPRYLALKNRVEEWIKGAAADVDIIDFHNYQWHKNRIMSGLIQYLKDKMVEYNYPAGIPIFTTENSGPLFIREEEGITYENLPAKIAEEVIKKNVIALECGVSRFYWSSLLPTLNWGENYIRLALIDPSRIKQPSFYTYQIMTSMLDGFTAVEAIALDGSYFFKFDVNNQTIFVLWNKKGPKTVDLNPYVSTSKVIVTHIVKELDGDNNPVYQPEEITPADAVTISEEPVFIVQFYSG